MKYLIMLLVIYSLDTSTIKAQSINKKIEQEVLKSVNKFVKNTNPIYLNTISELILKEDSIDKLKISYQKYSLIYLGEVSEKNLCGGAMNSYTQDQKSPFLYYTYVIENNKTTIWVLSGTDSF
jgi:hypothetical protein